ncbi:acyl-CoA dehydrogenase family protein [Aeromicrobium sp. UC242_57]|uniref:acyl-CoA dehydrogenase family protein n=1 Tax=Aeromicrobium sp. UC242_57 TaxID=3374624 RepID=UPI0037A2246B
MFLVDAEAEGLDVTRHIRTTDRSMIGGHCVVALDGLRVTQDDVLGEVDEGFRYAQVRLGPARMTHCMRWLGAAQRAHDVALAWVGERQAFGGLVSDLGMVQQMIADSEIDLAASRALILRACWEA